MKKNKVLLSIGAVVIMILLILAIGYYYAGDKEPRKVTAISIVVYGNDSERWEKLRSGAEQSGDLQSAEINLVTMTDETTASEEIRLLQRELDGGADALMIAACDSSRLQQSAEELSGRIPVVFVESGIGEEKENICIRADDYKMGYELGEELLRQEPEESKVAVICEHRQRDSVERRYQGLCDALEGKVDRVTLWERRDNEKDLKAMLFLQRQLTEEAVDAAVALDNSTTEAIVDAVENLDKNVSLYGIGNSDKAVSYLDKGFLRALCYQNEYKIGYMGVQEVMKEQTKQAKESYEPVEYKIVTKKTLYEADNQKMLFPFVK